MQKRLHCRSDTSGCLSAREPDRAHRHMACKQTGAPAHVSIHSRHANSKGKPTSMFGLAKLAPAVRRIAPALATRAAAGGWMKRDEAVMGTSIGIELWSESRAEGESAIRV